MNAQILHLPPRSWAILTDVKLDIVIKQASQWLITVAPGRPNRVEARCESALDSPMLGRTNVVRRSVSNHYVTCITFSSYGARIEYDRAFSEGFYQLCYRNEHNSPNSTTRMRTIRLSPTHHRPTLPPLGPRRPSVVHPIPY